MKLRQLPFELAEYHFAGKMRKAVIKKDSGYQIRVLKRMDRNYVTGETTVAYDYFMLDKEGVILKAPRGYAKKYKGVKITDIAEAAKDDG
jgi:hypothetical protein